MNNLTQSLKGPVIFISLLPFIITPIIGALAIRWLFVGEGILTSLIEYLLERDIALFANADFQTLPWLLYQLSGKYAADEAHALAMLVMLLTVGLFLTARFVTDRALRGRHA